MTKEKKIIIGIISILTIVIVLLSYFLINKNAIIEKQAEEIGLQAMETNGSNSYVTTQEHLNEIEQSISKGIEKLDLITSSNVSSTTTTSSTTDTININISDYNQVLIITSMVGLHWTFNESMSLNFTNILVNDENIWFCNLLHGTGGSGSQNGQVAYAAAIANCNANTSNQLKIVTKTSGINTSLTKYYKIYGIKK